MEAFVSPLLALFKRSPSYAADVVARPQWERHFAAKGAQGMFVLFEPESGRQLLYNASRARQRFIPAATFEIAIGLIGLELAAVADDNERFPWDGKPKPCA